MRAEGYLSVAEAGERLGVTARTLRYYEELGFLTPVRTAGGHRLFSPADLEVFARIARMQTMGFSLATIRRALRYRSYQDDQGRHRLAAGDLAALLDEARGDAATMRERIAALRRELDEATREVEALEHDVSYLERALVERRATEQHGNAR